MSISHTEQRIQSLVDRAITEATTPVTITRGDGSTFVGCKMHQSAEDGDFQVYVVPVEQRTVTMKPHFRVTYYLKIDGHFKRVNRQNFVDAMGGDTTHENRQ